MIKVDIVNEVSRVADVTKVKAELWPVSKIERDASKPERLVTVRGLGYKLLPT